MPSSHPHRTIPARAHWAIGLAATIFATAAAAHTGTDGGLAHTHDALGSFMAGAAHPLTGLDHLAAMVSVGLWAALGAARAATAPHPSARQLLSTPLAFVAALLLGAMMALGGLRLPGTEPMIAASLLVTGLLVASRTALPAAAGAALVAGFALFHGLAHGQELGDHASAALAGMVFGTMALHAAGLGLGLAMRRRTRWLAGIAGTGVAAMGLGLLAPTASALF